jgi:hypothetical protein
VRASLLLIFPDPWLSAAPIPRSPADLAFPGVKGKPNYVIHSIEGVVVPGKVASNLGQVAAALSE